MSGTVNAVEFITGMQILCIPVFLLFVRRRLGRCGLQFFWDAARTEPPNYVQSDIKAGTAVRIEKGYETI